MIPDTCQQCGERLEPGFAACWKCGTVAIAVAPAGTDARAESAWETVVLTTASTLDGHRVVRTLDIITAESVYAIDALRDWLSSVSYIVEDHGSSQNVLRAARLICLRELRQEAARLGANAVIAVDLKYNEITGGGEDSMLFLAASGTAVVVEPV